LKVTGGFDSIANRTVAAETASDRMGCHFLSLADMYRPDQAPPSRLNSKVHSVCANVPAHVPATSVATLPCAATEDAGPANVEQTARHAIVANTKLDRVNIQILLIRQ
jgi:hypothetical protein